MNRNRWIKLVLSLEILNTSLHFNNVSLNSLDQSIDAHLDDITVQQEHREQRLRN